MTVKPLSMEIDLDSEGSDVSGAVLVRSVNTTSSAKTVTVTNSDGDDVASLTLAPGESLSIQKASSDTLSCASSGVKVVKVAFSN